MAAAAEEAVAVLGWRVAAGGGSGDGFLSGWFECYRLGTGEVEVK